MPSDAKYVFGLGAINVNILVGAPSLLTAAAVVVVGGVVIGVIGCGA